MVVVAALPGLAHTLDHVLTPYCIGIRLNTVLIHLILLMCVSLSFVRSLVAQRWRDRCVQPRRTTHEASLLLLVQ
jgi:hypothetical protein